MRVLSSYRPIIWTLTLHFFDIWLACEERSLVATRVEREMTRYPCGEGDDAQRNICIILVRITNMF
jgi:hypothetical protein